MKYFFFILISAFSGFVSSQNIIPVKYDLTVKSLFYEADSLIIALKEKKEVNFLIILDKDTLSDWCNSYRVKFAVDSCETDYRRYINEDNEIHTIHIGYIQYRSREANHQTCVQMFPKFEEDLKEYFLTVEPESYNYKHDYILIGRINGKFIHEQFNRDFVIKHHPGLLYDVLQRFGF